MNAKHPRLLLTDRDREILLVLTQKVRLLSLRQIAAHWWERDLANTRRRLKQLQAAGFLQRISVRARPTPELPQPIVSWKPGAESPEFGKTAHQCQSRWRDRPVRTIAAYVASRQAAQRVGGIARGELKNPLQATHDLGVAAVWLKLDEEAPAWAEAWRGEDLLAHTRRGQKLPDAFLVDAAGQVVWAIEFGGSYDAQRVRDFHEDCARRNLPYQIW